MLQNYEIEYFQTKQALDLQAKWQLAGMSEDEIVAKLKENAVFYKRLERLKNENR
jgi:hypothetical protein